MRARIITIGDELLIGQVVDTNSAWLGEKLTSTGVEVDQIVSIQDKEDEIVRHLSRGVDEVDIIILSGGLGPTKDDITKSSIARYLDVPMFYSQEVFDGIVHYLAKHGRKPVAAIENHSWFPEGCIFLKNEMGTAPGMLFRKNGALIISVPGVPYEMKFIMENEGLPLIKAMNQNVKICQRTILTVGEFEARLSDRIEDIVEALPLHFSIAFLPNLNQVRLRLTATGNDKITLEKELDLQVEKILKRLGN